MMGIIGFMIVCGLFFFYSCLVNLPEHMKEVEDEEQMMYLAKYQKNGKSTHN